MNYAKDVVVGFYGALVCGIGVALLPDHPILAGAVGAAVGSFVGVFVHHVIWERAKHTDGESRSNESVRVREPTGPGQSIDSYDVCLQAAEPLFWGAGLILGFVPSAMVYEWLEHQTHGEFHSHWYAGPVTLLLIMIFMSASTLLFMAVASLVLSLVRSVLR